MLFIFISYTSPVLKLFSVQVPSPDWNTKFPAIIKLAPESLKGQNFAFLIFMLYCQMPPNVQLNFKKHDIGQNRRSSFEVHCKVQDYKDGSEVQLIKFHFVTSSQKNRKCHSWILIFYWRYFLSLVNTMYFFVWIAFGNFFFLFQDNKASLKQASNTHAIMKTWYFCWVTVPVWLGLNNILWIQRIQPYFYIVTVSKRLFTGKQIFQECHNNNEIILKHCTEYAMKKTCLLLHICTSKARQSCTAAVILTGVPTNLIFSWFESWRAALFSHQYLQGTKMAAKMALQGTKMVAISGKSNKGSAH